MGEQREIPEQNTVSSPSRRAFLKRAAKVTGGIVLLTTGQVGLAQAEPSPSATSTSTPTGTPTPDAVGTQIAQENQRLADLEKQIEQREKTATREAVRRIEADKLKKAVATAEQKLKDIDNPPTTTATATPTSTSTSTPSNTPTATITPTPTADKAATAAARATIDNASARYRAELQASATAKAENFNTPTPTQSKDFGDKGNNKAGDNEAVNFWEVVGKASMPLVGLAGLGALSRSAKVRGEVSRAIGFVRTKLGI